MEDPRIGVLEEVYALERCPKMPNYSRADRREKRKITAVKRRRTERTKESCATTDFPPPQLLNSSSLNRSAVLHDNDTKIGSYVKSRCSLGRLLKKRSR